VQISSFTASSGVPGTTWTSTAKGASWLQANLPRDTRITAVYIGVTYAGLPIRGGGSLPVRLVLEGFDGTAWTRLLVASSNVVGDLGRIAANVTAAPYYAVRLSSLYAMTVRLLGPELTRPGRQLHAVHGPGLRLRRDRRGPHQAAADHPRALRVRQPVSRAGRRPVHGFVSRFHD
jgi:hypothetical protein